MDYMDACNEVFENKSLDNSVELCLRYPVIEMH